MYAKDMFCGGCTFIDHGSGYVLIWHQVNLREPDMIKSKMKFEIYAFNIGVVLKIYHTDNSVFTEDKFTNQLIESNQTIELSVIGVAHHNGVAERLNKTVVNMDQTMMLHAVMHSPEGTIIEDIWPMSMDYDVWLYNQIIKIAMGIYLYEIRTRSI